MPNLRFEFDWLDAEGVRGAEISATWASLKILVGDSPVTRVLDTRAKTTRDFVHVPLYPLAEWFAVNWWFLKSEVQSPAKQGAPDFLRRHALAANREGYAFPRLEAVPAGARTKLFWENDSSPWFSVRFIEHGDAWVDSGEFQETCADFINQVIHRLAHFGIEDTFLQREWDAIQSADEDEARFCEAAAAIGWDPYALDDASRDLVIAISDQLGDLLDEALPALDANNPKAESDDIKRAVEDSKANGVPLERIRKIRQSELARGANRALSPWESGYDLARRLRRSLDIGDEPMSDMAKLADALEEDRDLLDKAARPVESLARVQMIDGVVLWNDDLPGFAFRRSGHESGQRFAFCRALGETLTSSSDTLITRAHSERQQRNRAFAAEFLAPSDGLMKMVAARPAVDLSDVDEIAERFGVSPFVVKHQIENHNLARVWQT